MRRLNDVYLSPITPRERVLKAIARYQVEPGYRPAPPRAVYRVTWPSGLQVSPR